MLRHGDTGDWVGTFEGHKGAVWGVALTRTATLAASGAADFSGKHYLTNIRKDKIVILFLGKVWNAVTGEELHSFQHNHIVKTVAFDSQSQHLVTGNNEKLIRVYDLNQPNESPEIFKGHSGNIKRALFCRNDQYLISCAEDKSIRVWDRRSGQEVQHVDFPANPNSIEISRDESVVTVTHGSSVAFFETDTLKKLKEITIPTRVSAASLHPVSSLDLNVLESLIIHPFFRKRIFSFAVAKTLKCTNTTTSLATRLVRL